MNSSGFAELFLRKTVSIMADVPNFALEISLGVIARTRSNSFSFLDCGSFISKATNNPTAKEQEDIARAGEYRRLRLEIIIAERAEIVRLRDRDIISDDAMRLVQKDLDLEETLLSKEEDRDNLTNGLEEHSN